MILIVSSQFNKVAGISKSLEDSAIAVLKDNGMNYKIVHVPGAIEIPITVQTFLKTGEYQAAIALGCVIKGETDHYEMVIRACTDGLSRVSLDTGIPVIQGVLVSPNDELAIKRKELGKEYAETALKMIEILKK